MSILSPTKLQQAVTYNGNRPYSSAEWRQIQALASAPVNGVPDDRTAEQVAFFQQTHHLSVDGKVGPATLAAMRQGRIYTLPGRSPFFYYGKMEIDADGAPNAYHPDNIGIDNLANARNKKGDWVGVVMGEQDGPCVQRASDPCPGFYVSPTSLCDHTYSCRDPRRYVDATKIPYVVLPKNIRDLVNAGVLKLGDVALVLRTANPQQRVYAIYADVGPKVNPDSDTLFGEGSVRLAQALGHEPFNAKGKACRNIPGGVFYVVFPGSGKGKPLAVEEIDALGAQAFQTWGGEEALYQAMKMAGALPS